MSVFSLEILYKQDKSTILLKVHKIFFSSYSLSNFSRLKNTLSGREAMLLEDKSLLREKKNYQTK